MKRERYLEKLVAWKNAAHRKPLILEGARQVGKTWLMQEFAKAHFRNVVYLRFDKNATLRRIFTGDLDVERIVHELEILAHTRIDADDTILLFDEVQACKNALTSLKYFYEDRPELAIIAAGSLLGLTYRNDDSGEGDGVESANEDSGEGTGYPVGKVSTLAVNPMTFGEFLIAIGEEALASEIENRNWSTLSNFHDRMADLLRHYYIVGGMPEAVLRYVETHNLEEVRQVQREILSGYQRDISKHAPKSDVRRIEMAWNSIPVQLAKENKRFVYSDVKPHGRSAEFRDPLAWLEDAGLVHFCKRVTVPQLPLTAYDGGAFKLYLLDVGLLAALAHLDYAVVLEGPRIFKEFKGALTEQYVLQELIAATGFDAHYWSTDDSRTEIDFVFQHGMEIVPLEVKAERNVTSQSLKSYLKRYRPAMAVRASMLPYIKQNIPLEGGGTCRFCNVPLYAMGQFGNAIGGTV